MSVTPQTNTSLEEIAAKLLELDDIVICGHENPDGDCIGSMLGLRHALESLGKKVTCARASTTSLDPTLSWLPGASEILPAAHVSKRHKVFVGVDVPTRERLAPAACNLLDKADVSFTIDHHANDERVCDYAYVDPAAASCSLLIWDLATLLCKTIPREVALCCFAGLVTDTGCFCFQNTDARAFNHAAAMVSLGVDPSEIARNVYQNRTLASLKLDSMCVQRMEFVCDGKAVYSWISEEDIKGLHACHADIEPLVNTLRSVQGIEVACMLRGQDGAVRGSLRAKNDLDVAQLARKYGGGGHVAAAGFTLFTTLEEARAIVARDLEVLVRTGSVD